MDVTAATASAPTITTAGTLTSKEPIIPADVIRPTDIATTTMAGVLITATRRRIITVPHTTGGLITRGQRQLLTDGDGADRRGMAITARTSRPIRFIRQQHFG